MILICLNDKKSRKLYITSFRTLFTPSHTKEVNEDFPLDLQRQIWTPIYAQATVV